MSDQHSSFTLKKVKRGADPARNPQIFATRSVKPPDWDNTGTGAKNLRFIYINDGARTTVKCSKEVFLQMHREDGKTKRPLHQRYRSTYIVHTEKDDTGVKTVMSLDVADAHDYALNMPPGDTEEKKDVKLRVDPKTGGLVFLQRPYYMNDSALLALVRALDQLDTISRGDSIMLGSEKIATVRDVLGEELTLEVPDYAGNKGVSQNDAYTAQERSKRNVLVS